MYVFDKKNGKREKVEIRRTTLTERIKWEDFGFDWSKETDYELFALYLKGGTGPLGIISIDSIADELRIEIRLLEIVAWNIGSDKRYERVAGILIAHACRMAFDRGFYGFVSLIPKTQLIEHYQSHYGFRQFGRHLAVEFEESEHLMNKYLTND